MEKCGKMGIFVFGKQTRHGFIMLRHGKDAIHFDVTRLHAPQEDSNG